MRRDGLAAGALLLALAGACASHAAVPAVSAVTRAPSPAVRSSVEGQPVPREVMRAVVASSFVSTSRRVTASELRFSWRAGCPVPVSSLRALTVRYRTFDRTTAVGTLIVNVDAVPAMRAVFAELYARRVPIRRITPIDGYRGSDDASMAADNTSAFNCRAAISTGPTSWSMHAYGRAVDVNPVENPYLEAGRVLPPAGAAYLDRRNARPGMAVGGGVLVDAFAQVGWRWGGRWSNPDYQHFSSNGR